MVVRYKQKCYKCKKNYVLANFRGGPPVCYECQKQDLQGEIEDKEMKKMFDIPEDYYKQNGFLRNIKINYLRYKNLTEKQIAAFEKVVGKIKEEESNNPS